MKEKLQKFSQWFAIIAVGIVFGFTLQFVRAWTAPATSAPNGNVDAPINIGSDPQVKNGVLGVDAIDVVGIADIDGVIKANGGIRLGGVYRNSWPTTSSITCPCGTCWATKSDCDEASMCTPAGWKITGKSYTSGDPICSP